MESPRTVPSAEGTDAEQQYIHLIRMAWDLRWLGLETRVELPLAEEPRLLVLRAGEPLRVLAKRRNALWIYSWGRGRNQWIDALATDAAREIQRAAIR